jgi:hypothetical protein
VVIPYPRLQNGCLMQQKYRKTRIVMLLYRVHNQALVGIRQRSVAEDGKGVKRRNPTIVTKGEGNAKKK